MGRTGGRQAEAAAASGAQIGVESTDVVMLVMNQKGMERLEKTS